MNASSSLRQRQSQRTIVITGGSKGLGKALAWQFVRGGDNVMVCARDPARLDAVVEYLRQYASILGENSRIEGRVVDVGSFGEVVSLADDAVESFGRVDAWINNAGSNGYVYDEFHDSNPKTIETIVRTNFLGTLYGTREALRILGPEGHVFNMLGGGAEGEPTPSFAVYGATKRAIHHFCASLNAEDQTKAQVHRVSPGIVRTELLLTNFPDNIARPLIERFAQPPDVVAEDLVPRMRRIMGARSAFRHRNKSIYRFF
jgi:chlorophyll(ide) b reductase